MPKVSVIVPVYNARKYLQCCVDSVLAQTFCDFELLLVDDGSRDGSDAICDAIASGDPRIRVLHKKNGGVSSARNAGLDTAKGEYVLFLDSDDYLDPRFLEKTVGWSAERGCDIVAVGAVTISGDIERKRVVIPEWIDTASDKLSQREYCRLLDCCYISSCWGNLIRRDYIGHSRFESGCAFGEDLRFMFGLLEKPGKLLAVPEAFYYYRNNPESATKHFDRKKIKDVISTYMMLNDFAKRKSLPEFEEMVIRRWVGDYQTIQNIILGSSQPVAEQYRRLKELLCIRELRKAVLAFGDSQAKAVAAAPGWFLLKRGLRNLKRRLRRS